MILEQYANSTEYAHLRTRYMWLITIYTDKQALILHVYLYIYSLRSHLSFYKPCQIHMLQVITVVIYIFNKLRLVPVAYWYNLFKYQTQILYIEVPGRTDTRGGFMGSLFMYGYCRGSRTLGPSERSITHFIYKWTHNLQWIKAFGYMWNKCLLIKYLKPIIIRKYM